MTETMVQQEFSVSVEQELLYGLSVQVRRGNGIATPADAVSAAVEAYAGRDDPDPNLEEWETLERSVEPGSSGGLEGEHADGWKVTIIARLLQIGTLTLRARDAAEARVQAEALTPAWPATCAGWIFLKAGPITVTEIEEDRS